jgi:hypothetical protein
VQVLVADHGGTAHACKSNVALAVDLAKRVKVELPDEELESVCGEAAAEFPDSSLLRSEPMTNASQTESTGWD